VNGAAGMMREVIVYGIASRLSGDIEDFYTTRDEAEATLAQILADEPELEGQLWVQDVAFEVSRN
jgi:hypothetical protein